MKYKVFLCMCIFTFILSSCMFPENTLDGMITVAKLDSEKQKIYDAFLNDVGKNTKIDFVYPNNGDYQSAFIVKDLDNTKGNEAIVFYKNNISTNNPQKNTISVNLLDILDDGQWHSVWVTHETEVIDIDKFFIMDTAFEKLIVVGYNISTDNNLKKITVFKYDDKSIQRLYSLQANEYEVMDLNGDGTDNLITINDKDKRLIETYEYNKNGLTKILSKQEDYTKYSNIELKKGYINKNTPALFLDETISDEKYTDIIILENDKIKTLSDSGSELKMQTKRQNNLSVIDINDDNIIDIPTQIDLAGVDFLDRKTFVKWLNYDAQKTSFTDLKTCYYDLKLSYIFEIPTSWNTNVSYKKDDINNEVTFFINNPIDKNDDSKKLLKIKAFIPDINNTEINKDQYTMLDIDDNIKFGYILYDDYKDYSINDKEIEKLFKKL